MTAKKKVYVNIDFPPDLFARLCKDAAAHHRTFDEHIELLCEASLDERPATNNKEERGW